MVDQFHEPVSVRGISFGNCSVRGGADDGCSLSTAWSLNAGGFPGAWRALDLIAGLHRSKRPNICCLQENRCEEADWKLLYTKCCSLGYSAYATTNVGNMYWRGVITLIKSEIFFPNSVMRCTSMALVWLSRLVTCWWSTLMPVRTIAMTAFPL